MHPRHDRPCKHSDANTAILTSQFSGLSSDAEQSLKVWCIARAIETMIGKARQAVLAHVGVAKPLAIGGTSSERKG